MLQKKTQRTKKLYFIGMCIIIFFFQIFYFPKTTLINFHFHPKLHKPKEFSSREYQVGAGKPGRIPFLKIYEYQF